MKLKKVLCHINNLGRGGAERVMSVLVDSMVNDGIEVILVTLDTVTDEYTIPQQVKRIEIDKQCSSNKYLKSADRILKLRKTIIEYNPDMVLSFTVNENIRATISMIGIKCPLLVSVRNDPVISYSNHKIMTELMQFKASGCVFQTEQARDYFNKSFAEKSRIIMNPLDEKYMDNAEKHEYYLRNNNDTVVICNVGRIGKQKNQIMLIKAFEMVVERYTNCILKIVGADFGDGTKQLIEEYIASHNLEDKVKLRGLSNEVESELAGSDVFVLSSDYEGMPNALIEAMATGLAVISTDCPCGGPRQIIDNGINGLLVPVGDSEILAEKIEKLVRDGKLRRNIGTKAKDICKIGNRIEVYKAWKNYMETLV